MRHYGLLASRERERKLARCRAVLGAEKVERARGEETKAELLLRLTGRDVRQCERCGSGRLVVVWEWAVGESPPLWREQCARVAA